MDEWQPSTVQFNITDHFYFLPAHWHVSWATVLIAPSNLKISLVRNIPCKQALWKFISVHSDSSIRLLNKPNVQQLRGIKSLPFLNSDRKHHRPNESQNFIFSTGLSRTFKLFKILRTFVMPTFKKCFNTNK